MKNMLEELYYGNLCPLEEPMSMEHQRRSAAYVERSGAFRQRLQAILPELAQAFDALEEEQARLASMECRARFCRGFSLGAALILEISRD